MEKKEIITRIKFVFKDCPNQDLVNESIMYYTEMIKMDESISPFDYVSLISNNIYYELLKNNDNDEYMQDIVNKYYNRIVSVKKAKGELFSDLKSKDDTYEHCKKYYSGTENLYRFVYRYVDSEHINYDVNLDKYNYAEVVKHIEVIEGFKRYEKEIRALKKEIKL